jgi:hypothetical protein
VTQNYPPLQSGRWFASAVVGRLKRLRSASSNLQEPASPWRNKAAVISIERFPDDKQPNLFFPEHPQRLDAGRLRRMTESIFSEWSNRPRSITPKRSMRRVIV